MALRKLSPQEEALLQLLLKRASIVLSEGWNNQIRVEMQDDGLNRLLRLYPMGVKEAGRSFGRSASEYEFLDQDGVAVSASLYLDQNGDLFELDLWKTDDTPLIRIPDNISD
jgi:hypothetical protein